MRGERGDKGRRKKGRRERERERERVKTRGEARAREGGADGVQRGCRGHLAVVPLPPL